MGAITIRLPLELEKDLQAEVKLEQRPQSEIIRQALTEFLARRRQSQHIHELTRAAMALDPAASLAAAEEALALDNEALLLADGPAPAYAKPRAKRKPR
jgi:Arc/MetJ-type ribon-helix-helix transcriptional regulator